MCRILLGALLAATFLSPLPAQSVSGSMVGMVKDSSDLPISGAEVVLTSAATGVRRPAATGGRGDFEFGVLEPGAYHLAVSAPGFKKLERRGIVLSTSERLSLGEIALEIGSLAETVTVTAQGAALQTVSAERSGLITSDQVDGLLVRGRNVMSLLQLIPGIVDLQENESIVRNFTVHAQGGRIGSNTVTLDGVSVNNTGNGRNANVIPGQDSVAEVKVLLSHYQAEYGRKSGATVAMITKSGGRDFHGLGSYFKRHEQFNANDFFNNRNGLAKPRYRFNTWNYNIGGPAYIPGVFNRNRDRLFFFWSQEFWPITVPRDPGYLTMPTAAERTGDFSKTVDLCLANS